MSNKLIYDAIYGMCKIPPLAQKFIYTYEFQRMRNMKQLGLCYFVFASASGNRFEHSISVGNLAREVGLHLQKLHPDLVSDRFIDLIQVAGLTHDIGHGPFSHTFDLFIRDYPESEMKLHENRSKAIVRFMVKKYNIQITEKETQFICDTFDPTPEQKKTWQYQIISNTVDVDRLDYILRDSANSGIPVPFTKNQVFMLINYMRIENGSIKFDTKADNYIYDMLYSRNHLHERVYRHKKSKLIEEMLKSVFDKVKFIDDYNLELYLYNIEDFLKLDDSILSRVYHDERTKHVKRIIDDIYELK